MLVKPRAVSAASCLTRHIRMESATWRREERKKEAGETLTYQGQGVQVDVPVLHLGPAAGH